MKTKGKDSDCHVQAEMLYFNYRATIHTGEKQCPQTSKQVGAHACEDPLLKSKVGGWVGMGEMLVV